MRIALRSRKTVPLEMPHTIARHSRRPTVRPSLPMRPARAASQLHRLDSLTPIAAAARLARLRP